MKPRPSKGKKSSLVRLFEERTRVIKAKSRVTSKGQTVVPQEIRQALDIKPGVELVWQVQGEMAYVLVLPEDPVRASIGMFRDVPGLSVEALLADRREDLALEEAKWRRLGYEDR